MNQICDAPVPTDFLANWVRDRDLMSVEAGVRRATGEIADLLGLPDRGRVAVGAAADIVVVDWAALDPGPKRRVHDLPGGGDRLVTDQPEGIVHILVNGVPIKADGHRVVAELARLPGQVLDNGAAG